MYIVHTRLTVSVDIYVWNWMATNPEYQMRFYFSVVDGSYNIGVFYLPVLFFADAGYIHRRVSSCASLSIWFCVRCMYSAIQCVGLWVIMTVYAYGTTHACDDRVIYSGWLHTRRKFQPKFRCRSCFHPSYLWFCTYNCKCDTHSPVILFYFFALMLTRNRNKCKWKLVYYDETSAKAITW